jgi:hypothetical protein
MHDCVEESRRGVPRKGRAARVHLVKCRAETEPVASLVQLVANPGSELM